MATAAHTPGPWYITQADSGASRYVREEASDAVLFMVEDGGHVNPGLALPEAEQLANALLAAAAPDLLNACEALTKWFALSGSSVKARWERVPPEAATAIIRAMQAAVAKARGEQP